MELPVVEKVGLPEGLDKARREGRLMPPLFTRVGGPAGGEDWAAAAPPPTPTITATLPSLLSPLPSPSRKSSSSTYPPSSSTPKLTARGGEEEEEAAVVAEGFVGAPITVGEGGEGADLEGARLPVKAGTLGITRGAFFLKGMGFPPGREGAVPIFPPLRCAVG